MFETETEKVELYLSCRGIKSEDYLSHTDPQIRVYLQENGTQTLIGQTEIVKETKNPNFSTPIVTDFIFESQQLLLFEVIDVSYYPSWELIGIAQTNLSTIMGAKKQLVILNIRNKENKDVGRLVVQGEKLSQSRSTITWQWSGVHLMNTDGWLFDKSDPFLRFMKIRSDGSYLQVHQTEVIMDNLNPLWEAFQIKDNKLCDGNHKKPIRIECWDWERSEEFQYIGDCEVTIEELKNDRTEFDLHHPKKKKKTGVLKLLSFSLENDYSFIDYIRGGQHIKLMIGIDFTSSNKPPSDPTSLHSIKPQGYNEYQKAIYSICQTLLNYDNDKIIPVYGFGGRPNYPMLTLPIVSHCFACTGDPYQPGVYGIEGVMNAYSHALQNVELLGPTYFSPLISEVMQYCRGQKNIPNGLYTVLLLITDGEIHDMEATINCLVESSNLPLSIIIIGVGNEDFSKMEKLGTDKGMRSSKGKRAQRDLVQFVNFSKLKGDMNQLAQKVLAELPDQYVNYMNLIGKVPNPPVKVNLSQVAMSPQTTQTQNSFSAGSPYTPQGGSQPQGYQQQDTIYQFPQNYVANGVNNGNFASTAEQIGQQQQQTLKHNNIVDQNMNVHYPEVRFNNESMSIKGKPVSQMVPRYNLEPLQPMIQPLQERVNLNTFTGNISQLNNSGMNFQGNQNNNGYP